MIIGDTFFILIYFWVQQPFFGLEKFFPIQWKEPRLLDKVFKFTIIFGGW